MLTGTRDLLLCLNSFEQVAARVCVLVTGRLTGNLTDSRTGTLAGGVTGRFTGNEVVGHPHPRLRSIGARVTFGTRTLAAAVSVLGESGAGTLGDHVAGMT
jgi:hypothetical protein